MQRTDVATKRAWAAIAAAAVLAVAAAGAAEEQEPLTGPRSITGKAGAIYVDDGGGKAGLPVVFLHSLAGDSSHWASHLSHLRHKRRALAIDLRGHGKSARPRNGDYSLAAFVRDVDEVVDHLEIERFVLVGHSLGAAVAAEYAARHPKRVAGLVLVGAPGRTPAEHDRRILAALEKDYPGTMRRLWDEALAGSQAHVRTQVLQQLAEVPRKDGIAMMRALLRHDPVAALDRYHGPELIVSTDEQASDPAELHRLRPKTEHVHMPGTGHWPHLDQPKEFNEVLETFLAKVS